MATNHGIASHEHLDGHIEYQDQHGRYVSVKIKPVLLVICLLNFANNFSDVLVKVNHLILLLCKVYFVKMELTVINNQMIITCL